MEQQQQTKGIGKESQLSKIAAAVNPGSMAEANPTATQSMISTFMQTFESSALELRDETNDDQKELIKTMIDEITKLQTKNMKEFEKAIGKIVGITKDLQNSDNPLLQKLGKDMEEKSREEVVKASGYTLTGEKDTFLNRLGRSVGMNTEEEPVEKTREGIGKLAKGFASNVGGTLKRGFNIAVGREAPEGSFADNVFTSDEQKRERLLSRVDAESNETKTVSTNDTIKKVIEEYFKEDKQKSESSEKNSKETLTVSSLTEAFKTALDQHFNESKTSSTSSDKNTIESSSDSSEKNNIESSSDSSMTKSLEEFSQESRKESNSSSEENSLISTLTDEQKNLYSQFEKLMEEFNKEEKSTEELENIVKEINVLNEKFVAAYPSTKSPSVSSDAQEDAVGISKDATIEALQKTADSNVLVQENTSETVDVLKQILEQMKNMPVGGGGDSGGGMVPGLLGTGLGAGLASGAKAIGRGVKAVGRGIASGARVVGRGIASGARVVGSAVGSGARMLARGIGSGARALATGARAITAPMAVAGTAAVAATGSILYGVDKFIKNTNIGARKEQEEGTAKFGLTGNNMDGFFINGKPAGKYKDLPEYYQKVSDGYGANSRGGAAERAREYVKTHNPDGSKKTEKKPAAVEKDKKKTDAKVTPTTPAKKVTTPPPAKADEIVVTAPKKKAEVEKPKQEKSTATSTAKEATEPKKKDASVSLDAVDKSIKGKVAEIDPKGKWAKLKDGKIVDPDFPNDANSNNTAAAAYKLSSKTGKVEGKGNQTGDQISPKKATGKTETGKNIDGTLIEQGTAETKDKVQVNVPPPTVINQGGGGGQAPPQITFPGGVGSVRTNDSSWQRFQDRRAVG
jgi:hypothetical protein